MKLTRIIITGTDIQGQPFKVIGHINPNGLPEKLIVDRYNVPYKQLGIFEVKVSEVEKFKHSELGFFRFPSSTFLELAKMPHAEIYGSGSAFERAQYLFNRHLNKKS